MGKIIIKFAEWCLVSAIVLTYVEVGPGGEELGNIITVIKNTLVDIDWEVMHANLVDGLKSIFEQLD